jgi:nucleoside-diphosphate-sugar epimerase
MADIEKITSLPDQAIHREVDKVVLGANGTGAVKTAIVAPPCIGGPGRGPGNTRSVLVEDMVKFTLKNGFAPVIGRGLTECDFIHVHDLSDLIVNLVEAAQDPKRANDPEVFGNRGYYFCEAGAFKWGDVAKCEFNAV